MTEALRFDPALTINEIVALYPETTTVFNRFGLDTCCGGGVCVNDAARRHAIEPAAIITALNAAIDAGVAPRAAAR